MNAITLALRLSPQQIRVCVYVASGESYKWIGKELGISERTARFHADNAARRILRSCPWVSRSDNAPQKVIARYYVEYAGTEAFMPRPKTQAA